MAKQEQATLSATFWLEMIGMTPDALKSTLKDGFKKDPVWMIDQAVCAAKNVRLLSEEGQILSAFCHANYDTVARENLSQGLSAAVTGLESLDDDDALQIACKKIIGIFEKMAVFNSKKAIDSAVATKSQLGKNHLLYGEIMGFLVDQLDDNDYDMFKHIGHNAAVMTPEDREKFVTRLEILAPEVGYGLQYILLDFLNECADMPNDPAVIRASALHDTLSGDLPMKVLYTKPEMPKKYTAEGDVITLHPRRDPQ